MKKLLKISTYIILSLTITLIFISCQSNDKNENNPILEFQKTLIETEITGSNVAMVFKDNQVIYKEIISLSIIYSCF